MLAALFGFVIVSAPLAAPAAAGSASATVAAYETTADLRLHLTPLAPRSFSPQPAPNALVVSVNDALRHQTMIGFGAAMTDSSAWLLGEELGPAARSAAMASLFGPSGIGLGFVRIPMGASDFTATGHPYSYDDLSGGLTDPTLRHFSIRHDEPYILPVLRQMEQLDPGVFTLANPWSPPPWMKRNHRYDNRQASGVVLPRFYGALAGYFVDFLKAYRRAGVPIDAVTPQNEPRAQSTWPGAEFIPSDEAPWVVHDLVPALAAAGLRTKIYGLDDAALEDARRLLRSPARRDLAGLAFHCYSGGLLDMSTIAAAYPHEQMLESECSPGIIPYSVAEVAIDAARHDASAIALWNLALDPKGGPVQPPDTGCPSCTGVITVSERTHAVLYGANYYQLGQASRFVHPGAVRIGSNRFIADFRNPAGYGTTSGLDDVAFENPGGGHVLVVYNNRSVETTFALEYRGGYASYTIGPGATITLLWP